MVALGDGEVDAGQQAAGVVDDGGFEVALGVVGEGFERVGDQAELVLIQGKGELREIGDGHEVDAEVLVEKQIEAELVERSDVQVTKRSPTITLTGLGLGYAVFAWQGEWWM